MLSILKPRESVGSIYDIDMNTLWDRGYQSIIIDLDNTMTPWNSNEVSKELENWICYLKEKGFRICLLSNNKQHRVQSFARQLGVAAAPKGGKPFNASFRRALKVLKSTNGDTLLIGDQVFTDILGGNWAGLYTILVDPITTREFFGTRIARLIERLLLGRRINR